MCKARVMPMVRVRVKAEGPRMQDAGPLARRSPNPRPDPDPE